MIVCFVEVLLSIHSPLFDLVFFIFCFLIQIGSHGNLAFVSFILCWLSLSTFAGHVPALDGGFVFLA